MADMYHLIQIDGVEEAAAYKALTTQAGITGWWTSQASVSDEAVQVSFPGYPGGPWNMAVTKADGPATVAWTCTKGPENWIGTEITWGVEKGENGTVVRLDHTGFPAIDDAFRIVTVGWAQMLLALKANLESGEPKPFFNF